MSGSIDTEWMGLKKCFLLELKTGMGAALPIERTFHRRARAAVDIGVKYYGELYKINILYNLGRGAAEYSRLFLGYSIIRS